MVRHINETANPPKHEKKARGTRLILQIYMVINVPCAHTIYTTIKDFGYLTKLILNSQYIYIYS